MERGVGVDIRNSFQQAQSIHPGHIDVGDYHINVVDFAQDTDSLQAVLREEELVPTTPNVSPHALEDQWLQVRLVVNDQNLVSPFFHWDS